MPRISDSEYQEALLRADGAEGNAIATSSEVNDLDEQAAAESTLSFLNQEASLKEEFEALLEKCPVVPSFESGFQTCTTHGIALCVGEKWDYEDSIYDRITFCPICEWVKEDPLMREPWLVSYYRRKAQTGYGW